MNWWIIFLTGLTTGGLSCLAMQGGLLTSVIANQKEQEIEVKAKTINRFDALDWMPVGMFLLTKLVVHTVFGFLLGGVGSAITLNLETRLIFQTFTALFMFATAMNLLDVHPIFRFMAFQPPRFIQRMVRKSSKSKSLFAPAILGALTIFIPCGVTQAMEILAINSGDPVQGAVIMFSFVLGTSPLFAFVGIATAKLSEVFKDVFMRVAAYALIGMAIYSFNGVLVVMDASFTLQKFKAAIFDPPPVYNQRVLGNQLVSPGSIQQVQLVVKNYGYEPNEFTVQAGSPVELKLTSKETYGCALAFTFREFNIFEMLKPTDSKTLTFTPSKPGRYMFSCSMGMYTGYMNVV